LWYKPGWAHHTVVCLTFCASQLTGGVLSFQIWQTHTL
jgi:hypothetical protein